MKKIKIFIIVILVIILIPFLINFYVIFNNNDKIYAFDEISDKYDIALILGCSVLKNNTPSKMLKDRLDMGINLYNSSKVAKILISGDHEEGYSEVEVMYNYLINEGINKEDILLDYEGYSTSDSMLNYKEKYSDNSVVIVTQKYHLYRSLHISKELNIDAIGVHAELINYHGFIFREIREILARNKDFFAFLIK